jgi:hypothetical protein
MYNSYYFQNNTLYHKFDKNDNKIKTNKKKINIVKLLKNLIIN